MNTLVELNVGSESCIILSPNQYGCKFCKKHATHSEELILKGNPVTEVVKKVSNFYYDESNNCILINQNTKVQTYNWLPGKMKFVLRIN